MYLRDTCATILTILGTLFFLWFFYGFKWKFRANLLQGTHWSRCFWPKRPFFELFKKKCPFLAVTMKNRKMAQKGTFYWWNVSKLGQYVVCTKFVCWKLSDWKKVSGNTVCWFFIAFWSMPNLSGIYRPKSGFRTWFWKFGANNEVWGEKKAMLNGKYQPKGKNGIFSAQKCRFLNLAPNPKTKAISQHKMFRAFGIWSRICSILPNGALRRAKWHFLGTFWSKMANLGLGLSNKWAFLSDFQWDETVTGVAAVL